MRKVANLSLFVVFLSLFFLACGSSSDDYDYRDEEEEQSLHMQMTQDSLSSTTVDDQLN